jgi:hypothetical protein
MEHLTIKAASTVLDQGSFSAIAAAWSVDRDGDQIVRGAFTETTEQWQLSGKMIPLHWNHSGKASDVIGWVDPAAMGRPRKGSTSRASSTSRTQRWHGKRGAA